MTHKNYNSAKAKLYRTIKLRNGVCQVRRCNNWRYKNHVRCEMHHNMHLASIKKMRSDGRQATKYHQRKAAGLCVLCGKEAKQDRTRCQYHLDYAVAMNRRRTEIRIKKILNRNVG